MATPGSYTHLGPLPQTFGRGGRDAPACYRTPSAGLPRRGVSEAGTTGGRSIDVASFGGSGGEARTGYLGLAPQADQRLPLWGRQARPADARASAGWVMDGGIRASRNTSGTRARAFPPRFRAGSRIGFSCRGTAAPPPGSRKIRAPAGEDVASPDESLPRAAGRRGSRQAPLRSLRNASTPSGAPFLGRKGPFGRRRGGGMCRRPPFTGHSPEGTSRWNLFASRSPLFASRSPRGMRHAGEGTRHSPAFRSHSPRGNSRRKRGNER